MKLIFFRSELNHYNELACFHRIGPYIEPNKSLRYKFLFFKPMLAIGDVISTGKIRTGWL